MAKVAVCLSGCGFMDGSEIHEAVLTLLALDQAGATAVCCAPNIEQPSVIDHYSTSPAPGTARNILVESARIARGKITDLARMHADMVDALILPGGFGAAKNLCNFADKGPDCTVNPQVERFVGEMLETGKPIGAMCIPPPLLPTNDARRAMQPKITIGNDPATAAALGKLGIQHVDSPCESVVVDQAHRIVTTPAYMLGQGPAQVFEGVRKLVDEILAMI